MSSDLKFLPKMAVFAEVAEAGSFTRAGERLGLNKSVVSEHVSALEAHLGVKLFQRTTRSLKLTEAGQTYWYYCRNMMAAVHEGQRHLDGLNTEPKGRLRITTTDDFGATALVPLLNDFRKHYPDITYDLLFDLRVRNLVHEQIDLALRFGPPLDSSLVARKLGDMPRWVCASPGYLKGCATPETLEQLTEHDWVLRARKEREWVFTNSQGATQALTTQATYQCNSTEGVRAMALEGFGVGVFPAFSVRRYVEQQRLVRLVADQQLEPFEVYAVFPSRDYLPAKTRLLIDFLAKHIH